MRNGFKKWSRKVATGKANEPTVWTKKKLDSVKSIDRIRLEKMALGYPVDADDIMSSFIWYTTPQGWGYWNDLFIKHCDEGPQRLPQDALDFCKELLENAIEKRIY
jgi:hypothetical protein